MAIQTGFSFSKGAYGPYSAQIKTAVTQMSNANLIQEQSCGKMLCLMVTPEFSLDTSSMNQSEWNAVNKTIDLFSRVKNTGHAEMIATVLYAYDCLHNDEETVSDLDVYRFVMDWKKHWEPYKHSEASRLHADRFRRNAQQVFAAISVENCQRYRHTHQ